MRPFGGGLLPTDVPIRDNHNERMWAISEELACRHLDFVIAIHFSVSFGEDLMLECALRKQ
jgi:hypothetical protein